MSKFCLDTSLNLMPTLAILDESILTQYRERPDELAPIQVVWSGTDVAALRAALPMAKPSILALDIELLGEDPLGRAKQLADESRAEMVLLLHRFAPRETIREIARHGARPVKAPIRLSALRTHMTSVVVREILGDQGSRARAGMGSAPAARSPSALPPPDRQALVVDGAPSPRFSRAQLARLAEIQSRLECECPNHLSELLQSLVAFEDYSRACANRDDADARVHAMLAKSTGRARAIMEDALAELLVHERIVL